MYPPYTHQQEFSNKNLLWMRMDSEERFKLQSEKYPDRMKFWQNYNISYNFNSHGFRSSKFVSNNSLFLGCSYTLGEGISTDDRWSKIVADTLGLVDNNLGVNGSSGDTCFRLANYWIPKLTPTHVFVLYPFKHRKETFKNGKLYQLFPIPNLKKFEFLLLSKDQEIKLNYEQSLMDYHINSWLSSPENIEINCIKNILSIENLCRKHNSKLTILYVDDIQFNLSKLDVARDLAHPGIEAHKYIANLFLEKMD